MVSAIIVAAGSSRRMGFDKLFAPLAGKPVVAHSIAAFANSEVIDEILIVTREDRVQEMRALTVSENFPKIAGVISGGAERHHSVWNGLQRISPETDFVSIHDGARPLITPLAIRECLALAQKNGAACCAAPITDTVKRTTEIDGEIVVSESVDRANLWAMQTPQIFSRALIFEAYERVIANGELVTDEVSAVQSIGKKIALLRNDDWNLKVTVPRDLEIAAQALALRNRG